MAHRSHRALSAVALAVAAVLLVLPASALATPTAPDPSTTATTPLDAKKAERKQALVELGRMKDALDRKLDEYVSLGRMIQNTQAEIYKTTKQTEQLDESIKLSQDALAARAVEMYKTDQGGMFAVLLSARTARDFVARLEYLQIVSERDAALIDEVRLQHNQSLYLQNALSDRLKRLTELQAEADQRSTQIKDDVVVQEKKAKELGEDIARLIRERSFTPSSSVDSSRFNPDSVISEANFTASASMTAAEIQAFLDQQPGPLKSYSAPDHLGVKKTAAQMIAEACVAWRVSPKVIMATLQKEQSLLSKVPSSQKVYDWAMGCGATDSGRISKYAGFGNQIWWGAQKQRANADLWTFGATQIIDGSTLVHPANPGTHAQYRYTPHLHGVISFWTLYWRYFGDPLG